jgi:hypothetical protein
MLHSRKVMNASTLFPLVAVTVSCASFVSIFCHANCQPARAQNQNQPPNPGSLFPATSRQQALYDAKRSSGRSDPLAPIEGFKPFPSGSTFPEKAETKGQHSDKSAPVQIPAPPSVAGMKLIPPPPPVVTQDELPVSELPLPPDRPSLAAKLRLTGVIGEKAIFTFTDKEVAKLNRWPAVLVMGAGDQFESVETVSVGADSAVLEEDGERSTKTLERIR